MLRGSIASALSKQLSACERFSGEEPFGPYGLSIITPYHIVAGLPRCEIAINLMADFSYGS
jgi:hypothetical protein